MNQRGQALVEFVLILPIFLLILGVIVDFGNLLNSKNKLEDTSTDLVRLILNGDELEQLSQEYSDVKIEVQEYKSRYRKVIVTDDVKIFTPFLDRVLGNPCQIQVERVIPNE